MHIIPLCYDCIFSNKVRIIPYPYLSIYVFKVFIAKRTATFFDCNISNSTTFADIIVTPEWCYHINFLNVHIVCR